MHRKITSKTELRTKAGLLWDDEDFKTLKMDALFLLHDVACPEEVQKRKSWVFCEWIEKWENKKVKGNGDPILEQCSKTSTVAYPGLILINYLRKT